MRAYMPPHMRTIPPRAQRVFKGVIYDVYQWPQPMFDGSTATFEMLKRPDTVTVIAVKDDKIVAIQERQPSYDTHLTIPGGRNDNADEDELACAKRELLEETGMSFNSWRLIDARQPHTKVDQVIYVFLATGFAGQAQPKLDAGEKIALKLMTFDAAKRHAQQGDSYWPNDIFCRVDSLAALLALPALH